MSLFDEFPFHKQKKPKNTSNTFGPWVEPQPRSFHRSATQKGPQPKLQFNSFLQNIKTSRGKQKHLNFVTEKKQIMNSQISQEVKQSPLQSNEIKNEEEIKEKKNKNEILNTTVYCYHYTEEKQEDIINKWSSITDREAMPRKKWTGGSQNLQRILKMKDKLRERNKSVIKKTKQKFFFQQKKEEPLKLEMEGVKKETRLHIRKKRERKEDSREITKLFYQTIENMAKERKGKKTLYF